MIDFRHFLVFCRDLKGATLETDAQKAHFTVAVDEKNRLRFTPQSSRRIYPANAGKSKAVLEQFAQTRSIKHSDYKDIGSYNVSYLLPLGQRFLEHLHECQHPGFSNIEDVTKEGKDLDEEIQRIERRDSWDEGDEVVQVEVKEPLDKVIPVRLSAEKWEELRNEARELGVGPTTLARIWILDRLRQKPKPNDNKQWTYGAA